MTNEQRMTNDQIKGPLRVAAWPQGELALGHSLDIWSMLIWSFPFPRADGLPIAQCHFVHENHRLVSGQSAQDLDLCAGLCVFDKTNLDRRFPGLAAIGDEGKRVRFLHDERLDRDEEGIRVFLDADFHAR